MAKTQTKTEVRNSTAKALKLLRGIDNDAASIKKDQEKLDGRVKAFRSTAAEVTKILSGLSNTALATLNTAPAKPSAPAKKLAVKVQAKKPTAAKKPAQAKPAATKAQAKPAAVKAKAQAKKPVQVKKAAAAKPAQAKPAAAKPAQAKKPAVAAGDRPPLKQVATDIIKAAGKALPAAAIYKEAVKRHGYWSRQSLYNVLGGDGFVKTGEGAKAIFGVVGGPKASSSDDEANSFVAKVEKDQDTAQVS